MDSQATMTRELALRIGLAARLLPETDAKRLLEVLAHCVNGPLTESTVAGIGLETLKAACDGEFSSMDSKSLQQALAVLNNTSAQPVLPDVASYREGDMPGSIRIACGTDDAIHVNVHFGNCRWFIVYQVSGLEARLIDIRAADIPAGLVVDDKNVYRAEQIHDCKVVYVASIGGPAAAKAVKWGVHPMKLDQIQPLAEVLAELQQVMAEAPPPWLAKAMGIDAAERVRFARENG